MKKNVLMMSSVALLAMAAALSAFAEGDPAKGESLYPVCAACHGPAGEGNALLNAPVNAGLPAWYIERQLLNFRAGIRGTHPQDAFGMQMRPMAMSLADDQAVADVAAYVASLPAKAPAPTLEGGNASAGQAFYAVCMACHGPDGKGNKDLNSPPLVHQYDWYLVRQIENFNKGIRGSDPSDTFGMQMKPMAATLTTEQAIKDVVAYIMTLNK